MSWNKEDEEQLIKLFEDYLPIKDIAKQLKKTECSVRNKLYRLKLKHKNFVTDEEIRYIKENYKSYNLSEIAEKLHRTKAYICRLAKKLGIDRTKRKKEKLKIRRKTKNDDELKQLQRQQWLERLEKNGHPKGMKGKTHSEKVRKEMSKRVKKWWSETPEIEKEKVKNKMIQTRIKNGTLNPLKYQSNPYSRTKSGKRKDLNNIFFRSAWEANYARYLNYIKVEWEFEPKTFYFDKIKRGNISYTPDFYLPKTNEWLEIKGWMNSKSQVKIKRFYKYFPNEKLTIIDSKEYYLLEKKYKNIIKNWE